MKKVEDKGEVLVGESEKGVDAIMKKVSDIKVDNPSQDVQASYAAVASKNLIIIKAADSSSKAVEKMKEIGKVLTDVPIDRVFVDKQT